MSLPPPDAAAFLSSLDKDYTGQVETFGADFVSVLSEKPEEVLRKLKIGFQNPTSQASVMFPELKNMQGCMQDPQGHAEGDVWVHTKLLFQAARERNYSISRELALALLFHDIGKPETQSEVVSGRILFVGHEEKSAEMFCKIIERLGLADASDVDLEDVERAIRHHKVLFDVWFAQGSINRSDVRTYMPNGADDLLYKLMICDAAASIPADGVRKDVGLFAELEEKVKPPVV